MKILEIINDNVYFNINERERKSIDNLDGGDIFNILENISNNNDYYDLDYDKNSIKNDVYKSLVEDLIKQFTDFKDNVDNMKKSINSTFID
ncbi:hypothetical protein [Ligilactobacillus cholophilus]|uniref:hypothetical protein n=1 Tax=Ligilactobacillus cholophilus TaxID=3050131 RepID=UPI0025B17040|nr:hypothetical protein [Ligilactobacillus cholophilus]